MSLFNSDFSNDFSSHTDFSSDGDFFSDHDVFSGESVENIELTQKELIPYESESITIDNVEVFMSDSKNCFFSKEIGPDALFDSLNSKGLISLESGSVTVNNVKFFLNDSKNHFSSEAVVSESLHEQLNSKEIDLTFSYKQDLLNN